MALRSKVKRPKMSYQVMDVFNMKLEDSSYDAIVDKGTLDAVFPEDTSKNAEKIEHLFAEVLRVLKPKGSYICISLLQEHILNMALRYFYNKGYAVDLYEILIKNSKMYPFLLQIRKVSDKDTGSLVMHLRGKEPQGYPLEQCIEKVKEIQMQNIFMKDSKRLSQGQRFSVDLWDRKSSLNVPKYTMHVVDSPIGRILEKVRLKLTPGLKLTRKHVDASSRHKEESQAPSFLPSEATSISSPSKSYFWCLVGSCDAIEQG